LELREKTRVLTTVTRCVCEKNGQNVAQYIFVKKYAYVTLIVEQSSPKMQQLKKQPKVNNQLLGKYSPNVGTLPGINVMII
jgi:hypothetical protein